MMPKPMFGVVSPCEDSYGSVGIMPPPAWCPNNFLKGADAPIACEEHDVIFLLIAFDPP